MSCTHDCGCTPETRDYQIVAGWVGNGKPLQWRGGRIAQGMKADDEVTRIEWRYLDTEAGESR